MRITIIGILFVLVAAMLTVTLVGCSKPVNPPAAEGDPVPLQDYPKVVALDGLEKYVAASSASVVRNDPAPMRVSVPVRLLSNREVHIQYKFEFFDTNNHQIQPAMGWTYARMPARAQIFLDGASLDSAAVDWRLLIRPAR